MTVWRYSAKESLNRIYRVLKGEPEPNATPDDMTYEVLSENQALSQIAQLLEGTNPADNGNVPNALVRYGGVWTWTGTTTFTAIGTTFSKITGTFQNNQDDVGVTSDYYNDRIVINDIGTYFVAWQMSFFGSPDIMYTAEPYNAAIGIPQAAASSVGSSGTSSAHSMSGNGYTYVSGTAVQIDLRVKASATAWLQPWRLQLNVMRVSKP